MQLIFSPRVWLNPVLGVFRPLESAVLRLWIDGAEDQLRSVLQAQADEVTLAQRHQGGREVLLYRVKLGLFMQSFPALIPNLPTERVLGSVRFRVRSGRTLSAEFVAVHGHLFTIQFSRAPGHDVWHRSIELLGREYLPPIRVPDPKNLPKDYVAVATDSEQVLALQQIYELWIDDVLYWILAEIPDGGVLGMSKAAADRSVYWLPYSGKSPVNLGESLWDALARVREKLAADSVGDCSCGK